MDKEGILAISRQAHKDEGIEFMKTRGLKTSMGAHLFVEAFLWAFIFATGIKNNLPLAFSLLITEGTAGAAYNYSKYRFNKKKKHIVGIVLCTVFAVACAVGFVRFCLGNAAKNANN